LGCFFLDGDVFIQANVEKVGVQSISIYILCFNIYINVDT
jgi:hypothetical protein